MTRPEPGSPEWTKLVTASKVAAILGLSPWESPLSLWRKMRGLDEPEPDDDVKRRGHYLEPAILAWWQDQHPETLDHDLIPDGRSLQPRFVPQFWFSHEGWAGATVDAVTYIDGARVIVEAKSAARMDDWGKPGTAEIPAYYLTQVLFSLEVTGADRAYVPVIGPYLEFSEYVVERDEAMQAAIMDRCREFYDSLAGDVPPPLDDHPATLASVKAQHPDIDRGAGETVQLDYDTAVEYVEAQAALASAKSRATGATSRLLDAMGDARYAECGGIRVARRQPNKYGISLVPLATTLTPEEGAA